MAGKRVRLISIAGPKLNDSAWDDFGENLNFAAFTNGTTATILPISVLPQSTLAGETIPFGEGIARLLGGQIAFLAAGTSGGVAASTISRLGIVVYRSFGTLSTQITNAGGALTSLAVSGGVNTALPSGQTFTLSTAAGATPQVYTTSAAVAKGALSIPVNSITPSATYAVGTPLPGIVGNAIAFGWQSTADGATGTPAFRQNGSATLPAMSATANPALNTTGDPYGSYLLLYPGDVTALFAVTDSSTFSVPAGVLTTMIL
jgi:hypothetical protein